MKEIIYIIIGAISTGAVVVLAKWFGQKKGEVVSAPDSSKAEVARDNASELVGQRDAVAVKADSDQKNLEETLNIKDSSDRLNAIANELKDL